MGASRLLLVDDDAIFAHVLQRALRTRGLEVVVAADAGSARVACAGAAFDYCVLDLRLGEDSGLALIPSLLASSPGMRILLLTGYASIATAVHAIKLGAHDYLAKPVDADAVWHALRSARAQAPDKSAAALPLSPRRMEWEHIQRVLADCGGNISEAARCMGMHRRTLQRKLEKRPVSERR